MGRLTSFLRYFLCIVAPLFVLPLAAQVSLSSSTYPAPANAYPGDVVSADIDLDGNPDILTTDEQNPQVLVWYGTGAGQFGSAELIGGLDGVPFDLAVGDFNGDGKLDVLASINSPTTAIDVLTNQGSRTFSKSTISFPDPPGFLVVADFNNDGKLDFGVASWNPTTGSYIQIYLGNGDGTFTAGSMVVIPPVNSGGGTYYVMAADLNKDGNVDLINVAAPTNIFLNTGNATFTNGQTISVPNGGTYTWGAIGDFNGDAAPDLFLTNNQFCGEGCGWIKSLDSWVNNGAGNFTLKQSLQPLNASSDDYGVLGDLNYDGNLDMVFEGDSTLEYAIGKGTGTFGTPHQWGSLNGPWTGYYNPLLTHDLNNDGIADVISTSSDSIQVLLNTTAKPDCVPPNSASLGSTVCSPAPNQTVNSTFPVRAAANGPLDILRIEEWVDGKKRYQNLSNQVRNNLTLAAGTHSLSIVSVDVLGGIQKNKFSVTVSPCSAPPTPGVQICTPTSGATVSSPVSVVASATPASGTTITAMRLYVDNVAKYTVSGSSLSASVALSSGSHFIAVVGYESNGAAQKSTETITVQ